MKEVSLPCVEQSPWQAAGGGRPGGRRRAEAEDWTAAEGQASGAGGGRPHTSTQIFSVTNEPISTFWENPKLDPTPIIAAVPADSANMTFLWLYILVLFHSNLPPQEIKRWNLGDQQHVLGAEEGPWLFAPGFPHAVVTLDLLTMHMFSTCTAPSTLRYQAGSGWSPPSVSSSTSSLL